MEVEEEGSWEEEEGEEEEGSWEEEEEVEEGTGGSVGPQTGSPWGARSCWLPDRCARGPEGPKLRGGRGSAWAPWPVGQARSSHLHQGERWPWGALGFCSFVSRMYPIEDVPRTVIEVTWSRRLLCC